MDTDTPTSTTSTSTAATRVPLPHTGPQPYPHPPLSTLVAWPPRVTLGRLRPGAQVITTGNGEVIGVDFAVWAPSATGIDLCLFASDALPFQAADSAVKHIQIPMKEVGHGWWAIHVAGAGPGQAYGLRAHGPWLPDEGHRFNPARLLIDPWAKGLLAPIASMAMTAAAETAATTVTAATKNPLAAASASPGHFSNLRASIKAKALSTSTSAQASNNDHRGHVSAFAPVHDRSALALQVGHACSEPLYPTALWNSHQPAPSDNSAYVPLSVVIDEDAERAAGAALTPCPPIPDHRVVLYEAHVKALTQRHPDIPDAERGTYAGLAHPTLIAHLQHLGVTTVCLLPVASHITERHLLAQGLSNHWGYNPLNTFTPEARFAACTQRKWPANAQESAAIRSEFRSMVDALHRAGLEVVLDVVFNHTCESDLNGPTLSWRGLGHADWYALGGHGVPHNFSGCGNSLNVNQPQVVRWVLDSLRWWVQAYGVDGFRFDLAAALGRDAQQQHRFHAGHPLLVAIAQDPVLAHVRLIAEPWDIGPEGHQTGRFPVGWAEWNDAFRDQLRAYWLGHPSTRGQWAMRTCASSDLFAHDRRLPTASIHFITAHDGFNLHDLTTYTRKHNEANGEHNRDGHNHNLSTNLGHEGPTTDPHIEYARGLLRRALLASLLCAQGTPQLLAGDEFGHTQGGNNNAYCQDNEITWLDWTHLQHPQQAQGLLLPFISGLTTLRQELPALHHPYWFTGQAPAHDQHPWPDIVWLDTQGHPLEPQHWEDQTQRTLCALITVSDGDRAPSERVFIVWHADWTARALQLPPGDWQLRLDSASAWVQTRQRLCTGAGSTAPPSEQLNEPTVRLWVQPLPKQSGSATTNPYTNHPPAAVDVNEDHTPLLQRFRPSKP